MKLKLGERVPSWLKVAFASVRRNFRSWATSLYGWAIILYSFWVVWQVFSGTKLHLRQNASTLVQLDLLQVLAFLVAWSALVITITLKVVNAKRDIEFNVAKAGWKHETDLVETRRQVAEHEKVDDEIFSRMDAIEDKAKELSALNNENKRLRQMLVEAGIFVESDISSLSQDNNGHSIP